MKREAMTHATMTFVGIGAIGLPMATLLSRAGYSITGVDPFPAARGRALAAGVATVARFRDTPRSDIVIVMVATPEQLAELVTEALAGEFVAGQTWIIMSTVGPVSVVQESARLVAAGAAVIDAPVTGGVTGARRGELVIFAAGSHRLVEQIAPVLEVLGRVRVVGRAVGDGQGIKVVNQHLAAVHIVAAAEALNLAASLGLNRETVLDLIKDGAAGSWMLTDRGPRMLMNTDAPVTSTINIFVKDSNLVAEAAMNSGAAVPMLAVARSRYEAAAAQDLGLRDDSRVIETYLTV